MLARIGPRIWDRIGPGIGGKYWDDPAKKEQGHLCYSAIDRTAASSAWKSLIQVAFCLPVAGMAALALVDDPNVWSSGPAVGMILSVLVVFALAVCHLMDGIRWTQLAPTMAVDGLCDDLYADGDEDDPDDDEEEAEEEDEEGPEPTEDDDKIVPMRRADEW